MILVPLEGNRIFVLTGDIMQPIHPFQIHTRQNECASWQPPQSRLDTSHRVVAPPGHCQPHISTIGTSQSRPLCHEVHHQVCNLHVSNAGQQSSQQRCSSDELGRDLRLCNPSPTNSQPSPPKVQMRWELVSVKRLRSLSRNHSTGSKFSPLSASWNEAFLQIHQRFGDSHLKAYQACHRTWCRTRSSFPQPSQVISQRETKGTPTFPCLGFAICTVFPGQTSIWTNLGDPSQTVTHDSFKWTNIVLHPVMGFISKTHHHKDFPSFVSKGNIY